MSWLSRFLGGDAKKQAWRNFQTNMQAAEGSADPNAARQAAADDYFRSNVRAGNQGALRVGGAMVGANALLGGGGAAGAGGGLQPLGSTAAPGAAAPTGVMGGLQKLGGWASRNPELILGAASTIGGIDAQRKAGRNEKKMLEQIEREYAERAPLRQMGLRNLTREMEPLDPSVFRNRFNPFSSNG